MKRALVLALLAGGSALAGSPQGSVVGSRHDFSRMGPGPIRATDEEQVCIFCHASHGGGAGMDNRPDRVTALRPAAKASSAASPTPTGSSRVCLSCHDGTVAVGETRIRRMAMAGGGGRAASNLGTDLRRSHPVSTPAQKGARAHSPPPGDAVRIDARGDVQCTSCHDPHRSADAGGKFLVKEPVASQLCLSCHTPSLGAGAPSSHVSSAAVYPEQESAGGFRSVAEAGCFACHDVHGDDHRGSLLRRSAAEDDDAVCLRCHASSVTRKNVGRDLAKPYSHALSGGDVHDAAEGPQSATSRLPETSAGARRHAACVDCHNPHAATDAEAIAPAASGLLAGVWGIDLSGRRVDRVRYEYEVCLKCHGDSANKPQDRGASSIGDVPVRAVPDTNLRSVFSPSSPSYHPVAAPGRASDVPSLKAPWTAGSYVYCSDCHASDSAASPGAARGPHGSVYPHQLERAYATADMTVESAAAYALCYKCHDRERVLSSPDSTFLADDGRALHALHVVQERVPCAVCHASHGVSSRSGTPTNNAHLIDFDVRVVKPNGRGQRVYVSNGVRSGSCSLSCHGRETSNHDPMDPEKPTGTY